MVALGLCLALSPSDTLPGQVLAVERPARTPTFFRGFIENQGQWNTDVRFVADIGGLLVRAEPGAIVVQREDLLDGIARVGVVRMTFENAATVWPQSGGRASGEFHYFHGDDPARWRTHVPTYNDVMYPALYPGTDVRLYVRDGRIEYDVLLAPSADLDDFAVRCQGIDGLAIDADGGLRMDTSMGPLTQHAPEAWQLAASGEKIPVTCTFRILDDRRYGLAVPARVPGLPLLIDPGLTWSTFLGGASQDLALKVDVLSSGDVLVLGRTNSPDFPTTAGTFDTIPGGYDFTVTCFEPTGSQLVFSTLVGGSDTELPGALAIASDGRIAVGGWTKSTDYPALASSYDSSFSGGLSDGCISALSPDGSQLVFSTLIGGSGGCQESLNGLAFTSSGLIVAAGTSCSPDFPITPFAFDQSVNGGSDAFVAWFDPPLSGSAQLVASSFLGGAGADILLNLGMTPADEPVLVGTTTSTDFPTTPGAIEESSIGGFITRFSADGSSLVGSTRFQGIARAVVSDGEHLVITGVALSALPVSPNAFDTTFSVSDGFVARLDGQLTQILAATFIGGTSHDTPIGLGLDESGAIVIVGSTGSADYPTTAGAHDTVFGSPAGSTSTSMVSYLSSDLSQLLYSTYLGPAVNGSSWANDVATDGIATAVVVGEGVQAGFPVTPGAFDETYNGGGIGGRDGYVVKLPLTLTWADLGGNIAGSNGMPSLAGSGDLIAGQPVTLTLRHAKANTLVSLIIGLSELGLPFKGGTLVPNPDILIFGLPTNGNGTLALSSTWPSGLPSGFTFYTQYWIPDSAGPAGFAASNGLSGKTP